jgi:hypothetical protein
MSDEYHSWNFDFSALIMDLYGVVLYYIIVILDYTQVSILLARGIIDTDLVERVVR